ncbi:DsbA family protein [Algicella marina]|uniref:Thioredoxin domain-containing protein n=1 Tax=Algicella marina TaxID=2683284 RepID=A0A6P1T4U0_9RHOB|nr:DsbA family protein [Algicella marina]QHQ36765.1 thioredoxin domain-containing protein [Algicella marina]
MNDRFTRRSALRTGLALGTLAASGLPAFAQEEERKVVEMFKGEAEAPVTVIEYASFTCPHCANFHKTVFPQIRANFIDEGKVKFVMREVYFDRFGLWAGMLARCGGEMRYFGIVDILFEKQKEWIGNGEPATVIQNLYGIGRQAGLTQEDMEACLQDKAFAEALVAEYQKNATADEVSGTPSFVVNGEKVKNMDYEPFADLLNSKLES